MRHCDTIINMKIRIILHIVFKRSISNGDSYLLAHIYLQALISIWYSKKEDGRFSSQSLPQDIGKTPPNSEMSQWVYAL